MEEKIEPPRSLPSDWMPHEKETSERAAADAESSIESTPAEEEDGANAAVEAGSNNYLTGWRLSVTTIGYASLLHLHLVLLTSLFQVSSSVCI